MKATRHHFIWIPTLSPYLQGVAGGLENHPLLRLSPPPLPPHVNAHALIHTLHYFIHPYHCPTPHDLPYFCALQNSLSTIFVFHHTTVSPANQRENKLSSDKRNRSELVQRKSSNRPLQICTQETKCRTNRPQPL